MQERLCQIMGRIFNIPVDRIGPETKVETVESWDSLNHINLVLALEKEFGLTFAPEEILKMVGVLEITEVLRQKISAAGSRIEN